MTNDELTPDEKQALIKHWLDRGKPVLQFGCGSYILDLRALLQCTDPFVVERLARRTRPLRYLLARWNNDRTEVPDESQTTQVRPGEQTLRPGRPRSSLRHG
jgi:hypothetical protein